MGVIGDGEAATDVVALRVVQNQGRDAVGSAELLECLEGAAAVPAIGQRAALHAGH